MTVTTAAYALGIVSIAIGLTAHLLHSRARKGIDRAANDLLKNENDTEGTFPQTWGAFVKAHEKAETTEKTCFKLVCVGVPFLLAGVVLMIIIIFQILAL
jgi:hypothetical protein